MLFFMLLLQSAPSFPDPRTDRALPRILDLAGQDCSDNACNSGRRYRLDVTDVGGEDAKDRALRGNWQACGTTGAPVCPTKPRAIVHADWD